MEYIKEDEIDMQSSPEPKQTEEVRTSPFRQGRRSRQVESDSRNAVQVQMLRRSSTIKEFIPIKEQIKNEQFHTVNNYFSNSMAKQSRDRTQSVTYKTPNKYSSNQKYYNTKVQVLSQEKREPVVTSTSLCRPKPTWDSTMTQNFSSKMQMSKEKQQKKQISLRKKMQEYVFQGNSQPGSEREFDENKEEPSEVFTEQQKPVERKAFRTIENRRGTVSDLPRQYQFFTVLQNQLADEDDTDTCSNQKTENSLRSYNTSLARKENDPQEAEKEMLTFQQKRMRQIKLKHSFSRDATSKSAAKPGTKKEDSDMVKQLEQKLIEQATQYEALQLEKRIYEVQLKEKESVISQYKQDLQNAQSTIKEQQERIELVEYQLNEQHTSERQASTENETNDNDAKAQAEEIIALSQKVTDFMEQMKEQKEKYDEQLQLKDSELKAKDDLIQSSDEALVNTCSLMLDYYLFQYKIKNQIAQQIQEFYTNPFTIYKKAKDLNNLVNQQKEYFNQFEVALKHLSTNQVLAHVFSNDTQLMSDPLVTQFSRMKEYPQNHSEIEMQ